MKELQDGILSAYIEGFYQSDTDTERALYGAYIIGYLEAVFDIFIRPNEYQENGERREERRMSYYQTMYGTDDVNTQFTDNDAHFGELVLQAIRDVECPMLITTGERDAVKKALIKALDEWAERKKE